MHADGLLDFLNDRLKLDCPLFFLSSQAKVGVRTQDTLFLVAAKLGLAASSLEAAKKEAEEKDQQLQLLQSLLLPDPLPEAIELSLVADTSSCELERIL